ncbi:MAG: hypothetical protein QOJ24_5439, partial [Mycobacterium sp.]|nr:hypothetical protein [Mycobacterium sp.]
SRFPLLHRSQAPLRRTRLTCDEANSDRGSALGRRAHRCAVGAKMSYAQLVDEVKRDYGTVDYYQGAYLINQAVNELCPAQIWQLRESAASYTVPA